MIEPTAPDDCTIEVVNHPAEIAFGKGNEEVVQGEDRRKNLLRLTYEFVKQADKVPD